MRRRLFPIALLGCVVSGTTLSVTALQEPGATSKAESLPNPFDFTKSNPEGRDYLSGLLGLRRREADYLASDKWRDLFVQLIAAETSYVGNYDDAIAYFDRRSVREKEAAKRDNPPSLEEFEARDAGEAIV